MTREEIENITIKNEHGIFPPYFEYESYDIETDTFIGMIIIKTAEEKYQEYLDGLIPKEQEPNKTEILQANVLNLQKLCIGLQKQIILK